MIETIEMSFNNPASDLLLEAASNSTWIQWGNALIMPVSVSYSKHRDLLTFEVDRNVTNPTSMM